MVKLGPVALLIECKLTTSTEKEVEIITIAQKICLIYKIIRNIKDQDNLSSGFDHDMSFVMIKMMIKEKVSRKTLFKIYLQVVFGFVEQHKTATYALGYMLRNNNANVVHHALVGNIDRTRVFLHDLSWYNPHCFPNIHHQTFLREHIFSRSPTVLSYIARHVSVNYVDAQYIWFFNFGSKK